MNPAAAIAASRFGLGPRPGDLDRIAADPQGWLAAQLADPTRMPAALAGDGPAGDQLAQLRQLLLNRKTQPEEFRQLVRAVYLAEASARTTAAIAADNPFVERLVAFWSNHFTVSSAKPIVAGLTGAFEREAIRPHLGGSFGDMLRAVAAHPAMLIYLDNARSIGPDSPAGQRLGKGLNENYARELLELHTLGVGGGYVQADVQALARILTGWSVARGDRLGSEPGRFVFAPRLHEPGAKTLLGRRYDQGGQAEGEAALAALAEAPATARHLATKLVRHFVADDPPKGAVDRLAAVYQQSGGDLPSLHRALIALPEAWATPLTKVKSTQDFVVSALRATGGTLAGAALVGALRELGQAPFAAPSPAGWPDTAKDWIAPEALMRRLEWGARLARRLDPTLSPQALAAATIGPVASPDTLRLIARAPDRQDGIALLLASAEFQRR
jgi:uncharacterized protein (DUF1800 family)